MARVKQAITLVTLVFAAAPAAGAMPHAATAPALTLGSDPALFVEHLEGGGLASSTVLAIALSTSAAAPLPSRIALYVPAGYSIRSGLPTGSVLGLAALFETGSSDSTGIAAGALRVADPAAVAADPAAQACDPGDHVAIWTLDLSTGSSASAPKLEVPVFIDAPGAGDPAGAAYRIQMCPPVLTGQRLVVAEMLVDSSILVDPTAPSTYLWRAYVTPFAAGTSDPDPAHVFEIRAVVPLPQTFTFSTRYDTKTHRAILSGQVTELGRPKRGASVSFHAESSHVDADFGPARTDAAGKYTFAWPISEKTDFSAEIDAPDPGPCTGDSAVPGGCLSTTIATPPSQTTTLKIPLRSDAKTTLVKADRELARKINLTLGDFPAGWRSHRAAPDDSTVCPDFHPNETGLTLTGASYSPAFLTGSISEPGTAQVAYSLVKIWRTPAQAATVFRRESTIAQLQCVADEISDADSSAVSVVSIGTLHIPQLAHGTKAFRIVLQDNSPGGVGRVYLDVVDILGRRSFARMTLEGIGAPPALELSLVQILATRAARS
jgi:hypothetical protein